MATTTISKSAAGEELVVKAPSIEVPTDIQAKANRYIDSVKNRLTEQTKAYMERALAPEAGEPQLPGGYQYMDVLTIGPIQFFGDPPYRPSKVIAAGELALMIGVVWINPANSPGGGLPGTVVLGGRPYTVRFETINLSDVADGPDFTIPGVYPGLAPTVNIYPWFFVPGDPGPSPNLYESNLTFDVDLGGQPFAAFGTWHFDPDLEPPFLGRPAVPPQWNRTPARYMVYRQ
jgi:hypothetical protein